ncbi:MAG: DnaJ domain-containing protein [Pseudomonadota bacterium]
MPRTYYDILKVSSDAETELIESAWRTLLSTLKKHPDLGGLPEEAALINQAHDVLLDPIKRKRYDASLGAVKPAGVAPKAAFAERRRDPRHLIDATVSYCLGHDLNWQPARVKDVSTLGLRIQSRAPLSAGQHLVIAPANLAATAIHGTVRWARVFHPSLFERIYEAGIEFADQITDVDQRLSV